MSRTKAIIGVLLIFLFGIIVGVGLSVRLSMERVRKLASGTPEDLAILTVARVDQAVRLTREQRTQAREIVAEAQRQIAAEQARITPEVHAITERAQREVSSLLRPDQLPRLPVSFMMPGGPAPKSAPEPSPETTPPATPDSDTTPSETPSL